ncbi:bifunctional prephenate dehydrogenase/3-phosphoshikimate 1-carboxyvinyltransferase [Teredinibacter turnerae]|uniref:bifunctional prephenate dehydrogenase/3-phosphoshikimate 1-carboxyvinyltransferase n=1 Tax=Teredinibacter turnerae TaxID=2426 RepID=UPI00035D8B6A|nr:bifunctional prephenate dehydrogenase/3-phosphoshikimate 1-carboxyvinyltransferase [Teredinibacter turnerae]
MTQFNKVVIVGLGLIGGSLAAGLRKRAVCREVIGVARRPETCVKAREMGVVDSAYCSLGDVLEQLQSGDIIFIAVPTLTLREVFKALKGRLAEGVIVTDGASVKGSVERDVREIFGEFPPAVVLGHPIAGSEKSGVEAAESELYVDHRVILTPVAENDPAAVQAVAKLWHAVGAEVLEMPVEEHDMVLGCTSHLPHVIAFSLVDTLAHDSKNENIFRYAAGGFRDFTRIASSDAIMWRDIMLANKASVLEAIDLFSDNLSRLRDIISREDAVEMTGVFTRAKSARDRFTNMLEHKAYLRNMQNSEHKNVVYSVAPGGSVTGTIRVPGDKSISHRSIMLGSLAEGVTHIEGFLEGEDALATLQAFRDMGVVIEGPENGAVTVHGVGLHGLKQPSGPLYVGNSGTSMRLLSGILAGQAFTSELTGDESLSKRPMNRVANPLREMGATVETGEEGRPPVRVSGGSALRAIDYVMPMASAQVKSCVLLAGLYADGETQVTEPAPTRDHTERMLRGFGYQVNRNGSTISLRSGGKLTAADIDIPADISSATFFMVAAAIAPGSDITLTHVGINPTRIGVINILREMGANLTLQNEREVGGEPVADIRVQYAPLKGIAIPEDQVPLAIDEFPALLVAAACAEGETVLTGAEELRVKETDRIQAMADGLQALGIECYPTPDGIRVIGGTLSGGAVESFHDHRIAMSFTVAALRASGPITVNNCANVATSFPNFVTLAKTVGISLEVNHS